jgi:transcriptional regulator with XRE-family HTH domain
VYDAGRMPPRAPAGGADRSAFGELLQQARRKLELNQQQLANRLGVSRGSVYAWERGKAPQKTRLPGIAETLGINLAELQSALAGHKVTRTEQPFSMLGSVPVMTEISSNEFMLEITGIRVRFPLQTIPIYVRVAIGPIESEVARSSREHD